MEKDYSLIVQNLITGEVKKIDKFSMYNNGYNSDLAANLLYCNVKDLIDNHIAFLIDYQYEVSP